MRTEEEIRNRYAHYLSEINRVNRMSEDWYELRISIDELEWVLGIKQ